MTSPAIGCCIVPFSDRLRTPTLPKMSPSYVRRAQVLDYPKNPELEVTFVVKDDDVS